MLEIFTDLLGINLRRFSRYLELLSLFLQIIHLLLKSGADITLRNYDGQSAVEVASNNIKQLLLDSVDRSGSSHRHLLQAAWQGDLKVLRKLLVTSILVHISLTRWIKAPWQGDVKLSITKKFTPLVLNHR